ncbi:MAG: choice-of-anchor B family protein [Bacteroidia bacterium]|nr:choice-of-anchor B family protein [Bacteroidia bacterium]
MRFFLILISGIYGVSAQPSRNMSLVGQLDYTPDLCNIWGYADTAGHEYALIGLETGLSIVSLDTPSAPREVFRVPGVYSQWREVKTWDHYAYVTNETGNGLLIVDLAGLPDTVVYKDTVLSDIQTSHTLFIADGFLYLAGPDQYNGGSAIFSLQDPWIPVFVGAYTDRYVHDQYVRGNRGYMAEILNGSMTILDLTDKTQPLVIGYVDYYNAFTHNTWLNDAGTVCYTTDELPEAYIIAWDITDPGNITELDRIRSSVSAGTAIPHNVHVLNDFLVSAYYRDGVQIVDGARPHNLIETGYYDTNARTGPGFNGVWGVYPYLPSGLILASDIENGLFVLRPSYQRACYLEGMIRDAATQQALPQVEVRILGTDQATLSLNDGHFATGTPDAGTYEVVFERFGYERDTVTVILDHSVVTELDIQLVPIPRTTLVLTVRDALTQAPVQGVTLELKPDGYAPITYTTGNDGTVTDPYWVIYPYEWKAGVWGHITRAGTLSGVPGQPPVTILLEPGYADDFALDLGWEVTGTAQRGIWERGEPKGVRYTGWTLTPETDLPDDVGDACYTTGNTSNIGYGDDVDNGYTWLSSPWIHLRGYTSPWMHVHRWFFNWSLNGGLPDGPGNDFLGIYLTNGADTVEVRRYTGPFDTTWAETLLPIRAYLPDDSLIRVLFYAQDFEPGNQDGVEATLDGFEIKEGFALPVADVLDPDIRLFVWDQAATWSVPVAYAGEELTLELISLNGQQVARMPLTGPAGTARLPDSLQPGMYLAVLMRGDTRLALVRYLSF